MENVLNISGAASVALHTVAFLSAEKPGKLLQNKEIAKSLEISENHLSKVLQRLTKAGFIESQRGPRGGVRLSKNCEDITLLDIFEAIEGPYTISDCTFKGKCKFDQCIFGGKLERINREFLEFLGKTKLSEFELLRKVEAN